MSTKQYAIKQLSKLGIVKGENRLSVELNSKRNNELLEISTRINRNGCAGEYLVKFIDKNALSDDAYGDNHTIHTSFFDNFNQTLKYLQCGNHI